MTADEAILEAEIIEQIRQLPSEEKIPLLMLVAGYKYKEIAQQRKIPVETIKEIINNAKEKIK
jgi:DNA-directed RNA polymerase specialized sigma24 family protein